MNLSLLAGAYRDMGESDEGLRLLTEAQTYMEKSGERFYEAVLATQKECGRFGMRQPVQQVRALQLEFTFDVFETIDESQFVLNAESTQVGHDILQFRIT